MPGSEAGPVEFPAGPVVWLRGRIRQGGLFLLAVVYLLLFYRAQCIIKHNDPHLCFNHICIFLQPPPVKEVVLYVSSWSEVSY